MKAKYEYQSIYKDDINNYIKEIELTLSISSVRTYNSMLKSFDIWCINNSIKDETLNKNIVNYWLDYEEKNLRCKAIVLRNLALNMIKNDKVAYVQPSGRYKQNKYYKPHIYSDQEILSLLEYFKNIESSRNYIYRRDTFLLIIKLLIFTGARKSDILNLKIKDIDFKNNLLTIINGKNNVNRIIPISKELMQELNNYNELLGHYENNEDYFFSNMRLCNPKRKKVSNTSLSWNFKKALKAVNIKYIPNEGPRIHDLRYTFIVKSIKKLVKENKDLNVYLPRLSKYVGHTLIDDTLYYFKPKELIFKKENYVSNTLIPNISEVEFYDE